MSDKPVIDAAMIKRAQDAHCCSNSDCIRKVLEAALNPPPEPQVVVTEEMTQAGLWAYHHEDELPNPQRWTNPKRHEEMAHVYRAMAALAPIPEVTTEAATAALRKYHNDFPLPPADKVGFSMLITDMKLAIAAALPILLGRKNAETVGVHDGGLD